MKLVSFSESDCKGGHWVATTYFFLPLPEPGPHSGLVGLGVGVESPFTDGGRPTFIRFLSARGQPDILWWALYFPVMWPEPSQLGVGHFLQKKAPTENTIKSTISDG